MKTFERWSALYVKTVIALGFIGMLLFGASSVSIYTGMNHVTVLYICIAVPTVIMVAQAIVSKFKKRIGRGVMEKSDFTVCVELKYNGKAYYFENTWAQYDRWNEEDYTQGMVFWWEEGNGSCDCNRSIFIREYCDDKFPEMECGDEIELTHIAVKKKDRYIYGNERSRP